MQFVYDDPRLLEWLALKIPQFQPGEGCRAVGVVRGGELVGVVAYSNFLAPSEVWSGDCELSCAASHPRWFSRQVGEILLGIPFKQFGVGRLTLRVAKRNKRARRFVEGIGFKQEGVMRHALRRDDVILYGLTRRDWENGKYGGRR